MKENILNSLCKAINRIPEHYFALSNPEGYSKLKRHPERLIAYELYHQLRTIIEDNRTSPDSNFNNIFIDSEIYKKLERTTYSKKDIKETGYETTQKELDTDKVYPDLVIHCDQKSRMQEDQFLIMECKTQTENINQESFNHDFFKLNEYISILNFQYSIYLIFNTNKNTISSFLTEYKKKYWTSNQDNVIFILKENFKSDLCIFDTNLEEIKCNY